jgi:hypothetical protein
VKQGNEGTQSNIKVCNDLVILHPDEGIVLTPCCSWIQLKLAHPRPLCFPPLQMVVDLISSHGNAIEFKNIIAHPSFVVFFESVMALDPSFDKLTLLSTNSDKSCVHVM